MRHILSALFFACTLLMSIQVSSTPPHLATYRYINGQWFNGRSFDKKVMYSVNGVFTDSPGKIDSTIDLKNQFIVPPFSEAHTHALEGIGNMDARIQRYLKDGVFYVKNPN